MAAKRSVGRRRKAEEWRQLIGELEGGGEELLTFCRRHGLHLPTLQWWRWRLRSPRRERGRADSNSSTVAAGAFEEVRRSRPLEATDRASGDGFELRWSDGLTLRIPQEFDGAALGRLLAVLEATGC